MRASILESFSSLRVVLCLCLYLGLPGRQTRLRRRCRWESTNGSASAKHLHRADGRRLLHLLRGGTRSRGLARHCQRDAVRLRLVRSHGEARERGKPRLSVRLDGDEQQDLFLRSAARRQETNAASRQHSQEIVVLDDEMIALIINELTLLMTSPFFPMTSLAMVRLFH